MSNLLIEAPMGERAAIIAETKAAYADFFETLPNDHGLVRMKFVEGEAPYVAEQIAGFPVDVALLYFAHQKAAPCDEEGKWISVKATRRRSEANPASHSVQIPEDWSAEHPLQRIRLANEIQGNSSGDAIDIVGADEIIRAEVERRSGSTGEASEGKPDEIRDDRRGHRKAARTE
jgi:hypothetical protein